MANAVKRRAATSRGFSAREARSAPSPVYGGGLGRGYAGCESRAASVCAGCCLRDLPLQDAALDARRLCMTAAGAGQRSWGAAALAGGRATVSWCPTVRGLLVGAGDAPNQAP